jgi:hypothetical protein
MRRNNGVGELGVAFWFLVAAFFALMIGRARAETAPAATPAAHPAPVVASVSQPSPALDEGPSAVDVAAKTFRGQVLFSDVMIAPASAFPSGDAMVGALQRLKRASVQGTDGFWRLHVVAFPSPVPSSGTYRLRATDTTGGKERKQIKVFEIAAQPGQPELEISDLVLTDVMGFERGHRYELSVVAGGDEDAGAGKADVYAQGVITLM